jgi:hypothetical protein
VNAYEYELVLELTLILPIQDLPDFDPIISLAVVVLHRVALGPPEVLLGDEGQHPESLSA